MRDQYPKSMHYVRFKKTILLIISLLFLGATSFAQLGKLSGKIVDKNNQPVSGAAVKLVNAKGGTNADVEGRFSINLPSGNYAIQVSAIGYNVKTIEDILIKAGQLEELQITLDLSTKALEGVTVKSSARRETMAALVQYQRNTNTVAQVVSAEAIKRSPDRNTSEVLKRVPGASIQEGKYLVIRGLADRYNQATLNGALLSSSEPDRKTFSFDIFPSSIVDNIIINKAAVPELPGEFAGGLVQVNTRDVPVRDFFNIQIGTGTNLQTIGHDFYSYSGGKYDWLGVDDGSRRLPAAFPSTRSKFIGLSGNDQIDAAKRFNNVWALEQIAVPMNVALQMSAGFTRKVKNGNLGGVFAVNYSNTNKRIETLRYDYFLDGTPVYDYDDNKYQRDVLVGILGNLTFQYGKSKFSWKNSFNISSSDHATRREGTNLQGPFEVKAYELAFVSNALFSSQLSGEHVLSFLGNTRMKWNGNFSRLSQSTPDLRRLGYQANTGSNVFEANVPQGSSSLSSSGRFFSSLSDYVWGGGADFTKNFAFLGDRQVLKFGYLFQMKDRLFEPRALGYAMYDNSAPNQAIKRLDPSRVFSPENLALNKLYMNEVTNIFDRYLGLSYLNAAYVQFDNNFGTKWKAAWGVRYEDFYQQVRYRQNDGEKMRTVKSQTGDFLPSANITYKLNNKTNLRLSASQTVIRPEFRELAPFRFYNFDLFVVEGGNPNLKRTKITNLDLRYELYLDGSEFFTIGTFYKHFVNPIERSYNSTGGGSGSLLYVNAPSANGAGLEMEFRKSLAFVGGGNNKSVWNKLTFFGNASYIFNRVKFANGTLAERPMQGQSNYVLNGGLQFDNTATETNFTILANKVGKRIFLVGDLASVGNTWEVPRTLLDFQITQGIMKKKAELKLTISDILSQRDKVYEDRKFASRPDVDRFNVRYGTNMNISFAYKL